MEFKRYLVFAGVSLAIHGVAFSANYKPMTIAPVADRTGTAVSIQLIQRPTSEPTQTSVSEGAQPTAQKPTPKPEHKTEPMPKSVVEKSNTSKPDLVTQPKNPVKTVSANEPITKELVTKKTTAAKKPVTKKTVSTKKTASKQTATKKEITTTATVPNDTSPFKEKSAAKPSAAKPVSEHPVAATSTPVDSLQPVQQARSATPKMVKKPSFSAKPTPIEYPRSAKRRNIEGLVLVEIWIDEQGHQTKQLVIDSSGHPMLDKAAINAITKWQFKSYRDQGQLIAHRVQVPITFELN